MKQTLGAGRRLPLPARSAAGGNAQPLKPAAPDGAVRRLPSMHADASTRSGASASGSRLTLVRRRSGRPPAPGGYLWYCKGELRVSASGETSSGASSEDGAGEVRQALPLHFRGCPAQGRNVEQRLHLRADCTAGEGRPQVGPGGLYPRRSHVDAATRLGGARSNQKTR